MRRFTLERTVDISGMSGTGSVAQGVEFDDGTAVVRWAEIEGPNYDRGVRPTTSVYESAKAVEALHGHNGATTLEWID